MRDGGGKAGIDAWAKIIGDVKFNYDKFSRITKRVESLPAMNLQYQKKGKNNWSKIWSEIYFL